MSKDDRLAWIYSSRNLEELAKRYDEWAQSYDEELENDYGYQIPEIMARELSRCTPSDGRVLDAGAGTGLVGYHLAACGYSDITAIDISREMLNKAREKNVYKAFHVMDLSRTLDFPDDAFDAVVCAGVLTFSHAPATSLLEMVRVTKPGGHVLFSLRKDAYRSMGFGDIVEKLDSGNKWQLVDSKEHQSFTEKEQDVVHVIRVYKVQVQERHIS